MPLSARDPRRIARHAKRLQGLESSRARAAPQEALLELGGTLREYGKLKKKGGAKGNGSARRQLKSSWLLIDRAVRRVRNAAVRREAMTPLWSVKNPRSPVVPVTSGVALQVHVFAGVPAHVYVKS